jgi:glycosyltransferase involved in cell wall biosynthesis
MTGFKSNTQPGFRSLRIEPTSEISVESNRRALNLQRGHCSSSSQRFRFTAYQWQETHHRSGWPYALQHLRLLHHKHGVLFDGFLEKKFAWGTDPGDRLRDGQPYREPWVGFFHNPPNVPDWFNLNQHSLQDILQSSLWTRSIARCRGLFTLSEYLKDWLQTQVAVPVCNVLHPTEAPQKTFCPKAYLANPEKKVVHIGWWLRKIHSFYELNTEGHNKVLLSLNAAELGSVFERETQLADASKVSSVQVWPYQDADAYDSLLRENVVFLDLYDSSANNAVIECIARRTPLLINRLQAVVEYLGSDYPLYFSSLPEAAEKLHDDRLIVRAHDYLENLPTKNKLTGAYFRKSIMRSSIYKGLRRLTPKVSLLTSVYEADSNIEPFLEDVVAQSAFDECEVLLFNIRASHKDPALVDQTISSYRDKFTNIYCWTLEEDPGLYEVWNSAIKHARGEYLTNANLDDRKAPQSLEEHLIALETNPGVDAVCALLLATTETNDTWGDNSAFRTYGSGFNWQSQDISSLGSYDEFGLHDLFLKDDLGRWVDSDNLLHCMPMWRRALHDKFGYFNETAFGALADWEFWVRCAIKGAKFHLIRKPLGLYLESSSSHNRRTNQQRFKQKIINKYSKDFDRRG